MRWALIVGIAIVAAITTSPLGPPPNPLPLTVEASGCAAVLVDGTCERPPTGSPIRIWINAEGFPLVVRLDDRETLLDSKATTTTHIAGGTRISINVGEATRVEISSNGRRGVLRLARPFAPAWATDAAAARTRGDQVATLALARPWLEHADPALRARAEGLVARAELALGNVTEAVRLFRRSSADAAAAGRISDAVDDALALSFALSQRTARWTEAGDEIDRVEPLTKGYAEGRARVPYYRALVFSALGDVRSAMRELRAARPRAERLGMGRLVWNVRNEWALSLERLGRRADALAELRSLAASEDSTIPACERVAVLMNLGFGTLSQSQELRAGPCVATGANTTPQTEEATRWLRASLDLASQCPDAQRSAMAHVLLGDAALGAGQIEEAKDELARVDMHQASSVLRRDATDLEGRIALARGDGREALAKFERLVALGRATGRVDDERRALEGMGEALEKLGKRADALAAFAAAEELLVAASVLVPIGEAGSFQGSRETAARARVELLLAARRIPEALAAARTARVRLLSRVASIDRVAELPLEARVRWVEAVERYRAERKKLDAAGAHDWELATSELGRARGERAESLTRLRASLDEALIALPRSTGDLEPFFGEHTASDATANEAPHLALFAMTLRNGSGVVFITSRSGGDANGGGDAGNSPHLRAVKITTNTTRDALEQAIVRAASPDIERARSVRVVTSADLACADVHAQRLSSGALLGVAARVTYGLDLGRAPATTPSPHQRRALVVSDTRDDLPLARDEGSLVASKLAPTMNVVLLSGTRASGAAVHDALTTATLFHYAGHSEMGDGSDLVLPLAASGRLTTSDVLALPMSPERVILSACQAGRVQPSGLAIGMGLVQAFLEKGAVEVIAPTRPVKDELALALARSVVITLDSAGSTDFSRAIAALASAPEPVDWSAYRVWRR